jgi:hypothetical protein
MRVRQRLPVERLRITDLKRHPVWEFVNDDPLGETVVQPVRKLPSDTLDGRLVGTRVRLANGKAVWALLGNLDTRSATRTHQFLTVSVYQRSSRFHLARYFDVESRRMGPAALARFLGLSVRDVFPIAFDVTEYCSGPSDVLAGTIDRTPRERLTRAEIIRLAVPPRE